MITAAKAALKFHISHQLIVVGENKIQQTASPHWLLSVMRATCLIENCVILFTLFLVVIRSTTANLREYNKYIVFLNVLCLLGAPSLHYRIHFQ